MRAYPNQRNMHYCQVKKATMFCGDVVVWHGGQICHCEIFNGVLG